ncbi:MAG: chromate efflux transporter [Planctomycetia bacterium]|nr:chromate efflux transporter [Planctomycetia bacterium]
MSDVVDAADPPRGVTYREAFWVWAKIAALSFGGPAGQIAVMHRILVEQKRWISEQRFLHALNFCTLLPGPEAQQLCIYIGWLLHRTLGGLTAGILFVLPGFVSILALSVLYAEYQDTEFITALFYGLKPAIVAVVLEAVLRISKRVLKNGVMVAIAAAAFVAIFAFHVPFPLIVFTAGMIGFCGGRWRPETFHLMRGHKADATAFVLTPVVDETALTHIAPSWRRTLRVGVTCLLLWFVPLAALTAWLGREHVLVQEGAFFSKAAVVTFGGAYAVLPYVGQQSVEKYGWIQEGEMIDGLGMAETTPGPLIQVVQYVAFLGAYRHPAPFSPIAAGVVASLITTWVTYVPCFLYIFVGAPYVERLRNSALWSSALSAVTAAVVGVILNLAIWFALRTLFSERNPWSFPGGEIDVPVWRTIDWAAATIAAAAAVMLLRFKWNLFLVLGICVAAGIAVRAF